MRGILSDAAGCIYTLFSAGVLMAEHLDPVMEIFTHLQDSDALASSQYFQFLFERDNRCHMITFKD